jgi:selenocysteine-specific elongation factor
VTAFPLVIGTAGHIDHGKTALVHALTGIDTDRLPVEKARGITTELGFAHLDLADRRVAVIDVPGHERFVRSMVAGAVGIDLVMLVVACDEGVKPQTREHLAICQLLAVRRGIVVLTKADLVDDDWLALVRDDVAAAVAGTFLAGAPMIVVSARTGTGLLALRALIAGALADLAPRDDRGVLRVPLDRVFTVRGFGTVVTGTVASGRLATGDELVVLPRGTTTRARGLEVHGAAADEARAGNRAAVNLAGVATDEVRRGDVLAHPGAVVPSHILDVRFRLLATASAPLPRRSKLLIHHGTTQVLATLALLDGDTLAPGDEAVAQLRVDAATPLVALPGDPFLARGFVVQRDHGTTLGGGAVIRVLAPRARSDAHAAQVRQLDTARLVDRVALDVRAAGPAGATARDLAHRTGLGIPALTPIVTAAIAAGDLVPIAASAGGDPVFLHVTTVAELEQRLLDALDRSDPDRGGASREALRSTMPAALTARAYDTLVTALAARAAITVDGDVIARPRRSAPAPLAIDADLATRFRLWGVSPPGPRDVAAASGHGAAETRAALDRLLAAGTVRKVKPDLYVDGAVLDELRARLVAFLDQRGAITPQEWKELTGTSRKYSIPLAEYFDAEKLTLRVGDVRRRRG